MTKLAIIGTNGVPSNYGGFETLVEQLLINLSPYIDITVFCSSKYCNVKLSEYKGAKLEYINIDSNGWQSIFYDSISILKSYKKYDRLLILGSSGALILPFLFRYKNKFILNFGGLDWKRNKWNRFTQFYLKFSEKIAVKFSDKIVSDNQGILDYIYKEYRRKSTLIAYGGDQAVLVQKYIGRSHEFIDSGYFLTVARIQKDNNIELILDSFIDLKKYKIVIIGNWDKDHYGAQLKKKYANYDNIYLIDAIYDLNELNYLRSNAKVYIHGHSAGGTNPALVEAMNLGLPIFAYSSGFNEYTTHGYAKYFSTSECLKELIDKTKAIELKNLGDKMKKIALENYTWSIISKKYKNILTL
jgi:glycosyltransferase involved in cell wall biosynthesis